ncbi:MAG TPA: hypothetical protein VFL92_13165 [Sphingomonas sp.]|nr:hypothetical protein [Sphingomonas sp.]
MIHRLFIAIALVGLASSASAQRLGGRLGQTATVRLSDPSAAGAGTGAAAPTTGAYSPPPSDAFDPAARDARRALRDACFGRTNDCRRAAEQMAESGGG